MHRRRRWVSVAELAEVAFTAFTGRGKAEHITAGLIARRGPAAQPR